VPKTRKNVLLLSTLHNDGKIDDTAGDAKKPEMITFYNSTKGGKDVVDEMCATYDCARNTRRWPMVVFYSMLNVAGINAFVVYCGNNNPNTVWRIFLKNLSRELVSEHVSMRAACSNISREIKDRASSFLGTTIQREKPQTGKRRRSEECCGKDRKTQYYCCECYKFLCLQHISVLCVECLGKKSESE
jgi:hypothetical protein